MCSIAQTLSFHAKKNKNGSQGLDHQVVALFDRKTKSLCKKRGNILHWELLLTWFWSIHVTSGTQQHQHMECPQKSSKAAARR